MDDNVNATHVQKIDTLKQVYQAQILILALQDQTGTQTGIGSVNPLANAQRQVQRVQQHDTINTRQVRTLTLTICIRYNISYVNCMSLNIKHACVLPCRRP